MFSTNQISVSPFVHIFDNVSLFSAESEKPKTAISGKGLSKYEGTELFKANEKASCVSSQSCILYEALRAKATKLRNKQAFFVFFWHKKSVRIHQPFLKRPLFNKANVP